MSTKVVGTSIGRYLPICIVDLISNNITILYITISMNILNLSTLQLVAKLYNR